MRRRVSGDAWCPPRRLALEDPKGQPLERVLQIRDDIRQRVGTFLVEHDFM
jgi:hypothetical protein